MGWGRVGLRDMLGFLLLLIHNADTNSRAYIVAASACTRLP